MEYDVPTSVSTVSGFISMDEPALSALLMGLVINLLFQVLRRAGLEALPAALACLLFGGVLYLAALQAQGIHLRRLFRLC